MHDGGLFEVVILLAAAIAAVLIVRRFKASAMLGYLAAGVVLGPYAFGMISDLEGTRTLAEFGVVFLLFSIGLDLSFKRLILLRREVFGLGTAQFLLTGFAVGLAAFALGLPVPAAIVIGAGMALSSTAIVMQILAERGEVATRHGRISFSILLLQDLAAVPLLAMVPLLEGGAGAGADWGTLGFAALKAVAALAAIILIGRYVLQPVFRIVASSSGPEVFFGLTLLVVLGTAAATQGVGLQLTLGAFLAGLLLSETEFRHQIEADILPFRGLLMGLFFISIGMSINIGFIVSQAALVAGLVLALVAGKTAIVVGLCRAIKLPLDVSLRVGLLLSQGGEFAFILIGLAGMSGVMSTGTTQIGLAVTGLSMVMTPFLAAFGMWLGERLQRQVAIGLAAMERDTSDLGQHVVIAGFGSVGQTVAEMLDDRRIPYVAIDRDPANVHEWRTRGLPIYYGDASRRDLLWGVGIDRARAMVVALSDQATALELVRTLHKRLPELTILARSTDQEHGDALSAAGAETVFPEALESSLSLGGAVLRALNVPEPEVVTLLNNYRRRRTVAAPVVKEEAPAAAPATVVKDAPAAETRLAGE
jgi:CPA2 family monovalent cation:H+ antiporter-2